ncbi:MAG: homoserine kinase [Hyphomicrobiaceae bacterium]
MAVYTEVTDDDLSVFLEGYDVGSLLSYKGIAEGVENTNYVVQTSHGPFILTLYEKRVDAKDLPFFLGLMEHLASKGLSCPTPVRDLKGRNLNKLAGRDAALVTFLDGVWPRRPNRVHCAGVGRTLAEMHLAGQSYNRTRKNSLGQKDWQEVFDKFSGQAETISVGLRDFLQTELDDLDKSWPHDLPTGVIHADMFPDNVFFIGKDLSGLIDFYFACNDALALDIAICLNAWCFEPDFSFNVTKGRELLRAYQSVRKLNADEIDAMPTLARGAATRFLLTRCYDWLNTPKNAVVHPHNPIDYLRRLRFHQRASSLADYGYEATT